MKIPYGRPYLPTETAKLLIDTFKSGAISGNGNEIKSMEKKLGSFLKSKVVLGISNGSASIRIAFQTLGLKPGDKVILPGWGFHVAANVAFSMGAKIEFRDVDLDSWCLEYYNLVDLEDIDELVFLVLIHTLGNTAKLDSLVKTYSSGKLRIIEDSAEAFMSKYQDKYLGTFFDIGTFSMHAAKTITTGEGGFISVNDIRLQEKAILLRNHGMNPRNPYFHYHSGDNYRLSNLLASIAHPQLDDLENIMNQRKRVYNQYKAEFLNVPSAQFIKQNDENGFFPWGVCLRLIGADKTIIQKIRESLESSGIESRPGFTSAEKLPYYQSSLNSKIGSLINSNTLENETIMLPHYPQLREEEIKKITGVIKNFLA